MAASEAYPYAKTGGLADVVGALPFSLKARGEEVAVAVPLYPSATPYTRTAERVYDRMLVSMGDTIWECAVKRIIDRDVSFYFIDCPDLYDRPALYGEGVKDYPITIFGSESFRVPCWASSARSSGPIFCIATTGRRLSSRC